MLLSKYFFVGGTLFKNEYSRDFYVFTSVPSNRVQKALR